jgi:hypothetical protein
MLFRLTSIKRLSLYFLVFGLAILTNYFFTGELLTRFNDVSVYEWTNRQIFASFLLIATIALSAFCFGRRDDFEAETAGAGGDDASLKTLWQWSALIPAFICYGLSTWLYLRQGETESVRWLWLASVVLLIAPLIRNSRLGDFVTFQFWEYSILALIVAGAFALRYVDLTTIPHHVSNDTAIMGLYSRKLLNENDGRWIGMALQTNHQFSEHQLLALGMRLFGISHYGLSMLSVIAGTVSVVALHMLGRILFNRWVGLLAAGFLAIDYVHVHFSRIIFGPITTCFVLLGALFLMHGVKRNRHMSFALGGIGFGLGLLGYYSGRVGVAIVITLAALWLWQRRQYPKVTFSCWFLVFSGMLFTFGPNLAYGIKNFNAFNGRGNNVIIWTSGAWSHASYTYQSKGSAAVVLKEQAKRALLSPFYYPDSSSICGLKKPMLSALAAAFFILGLGYCARRFRRIPCAFPLIWAGLVFLLGGILTIDPPFWPHLNIACPALALVTAVGAERFCRRVILSGGRRMSLVIPLVMAVGLCFAGLNNWDVYYRFAKDYSTGRSSAMRQIQAITEVVDYRVYIISPQLQWQHEVYQFFTSDVDGRNLSEAELYRQLPVIDKPTAFVVHEDTDYAKCVDYLSNAFPWSVRRAFNVGWKFTIIRVFPPGYVEPPASGTPPPGMWDSKGWRFVFTVLIGALSLGWVTLHREIQREKRSTRPGHQSELGSS